MGSLRKLVGGEDELSRVEWEPERDQEAESGRWEEGPSHCGWGCSVNGGGRPSDEEEYDWCAVMLCANVGEGEGDNWDEACDGVVGAERASMNECISRRREG